MKKGFVTGLTLAALLAFAGGCNRKKVAATPPAPAPQKTEAAAQPYSPPARVNEPAPPARVATATPSRMPDTATRARIQEVLNRMQDAYFDYDKHILRSDAEAALQRDAHILADLIREYPDFKLTVEGYCDERGSDEYNLALGDKRARQAEEYLATLGLPQNQLRVISYGKERQVCDEHDEACWQKNRRAHLTQAQ